MWKKEEWQKGQDLWSHLASNSFTFCSLQLNIRGPGRAKGPGTGARGRMSRLTLNPPAKPTRLCGTLRPSSENKGEGLTLARQPPVPGWTPSLLGPFKAALQDHVQALAQPITHGAVLLGIQRCDLAERTFLPTQNSRLLQNGNIRVSPLLDRGLTNPSHTCSRRI